MTAPPRHPAKPLVLPAGLLALERRQGYTDRAVMGGLGSFLQRWCGEAATQTAEASLQRDLNRFRAQAATYGEATLEERQALLDRAEQLAARVAGKVPVLPRAPRQPLPPPGWTAPLLCLPGIGPARAQELAKAGLHTFADLLQYYPARYDDRRLPQPVAQLEHRQTALLALTVEGPGQVVWRNRQRLAVVPASDGSDLVDLIWFNQPYRATQFAVGARVVVTGQVRLHQGQVSLAVTEIELLGNEELALGRLIPVYSGPPFSQVVMRKLMAAALEHCRDVPEDRVPAEIIARRQLLPLAQALREVHFPTHQEALRSARARLAYEELFFLQVRLAQRRRQAQKVEHDASLPVDGCLEQLRRQLPFALTGAQERVCAEALVDLARPEAANRLIHGDVGAGKTVIAALALLAAAQAGRQGVLMAPTEMLARQHHRTLTTILVPLGLAPALLVGSMTEAERRPLMAALATGQLKLVVGTHALFQESVAFTALAVAVIDEQHRFGVRQRALLVGKGDRPNTFIMSATPIPRTLALTAYGDFDVSILDELPPGRRPVHTEVLARQDVRRAWRLVSDMAVRGQQSYLVCPVIEADEAGYRTAALELYEQFRRAIFPSLKLGLVHGKMPPEERDAVMESFRRGDLEALVATTVIEVGVDVPNATAMVILDAERFGLAQLHQLRGRVARSQSQAYCVLVTGSREADTIERLQVLQRTSDGFLIAEEDLRRRGPGELAGLRQSGLPDPRMADLLADTLTLSHAREDAFALVAEDPRLEQPEQVGLREALGPEAPRPQWTL